MKIIAIILTTFLNLNVSIFFTMLNLIEICMNNKLDFMFITFPVCFPILTEINLLTSGHNMESFLKPLVPFYPCFVLEHGMRTVNFFSMPCQLLKVTRNFMSLVSKTFSCINLTYFLY